MDALDKWILEFVNQFVQRSWLFDKSMNFLAGNSLFKGVILMTLYWHYWFQGGAKQPAIRRCIIVVFAASLFGIVSARGMAVFLPFRTRPIHNLDLHLVVPFGVMAVNADPDDLDGWSSFPSDHAVLFLSLAVGIFYASKKAGSIALAYTLALIVLPRLYLGLHYFSDLLFGALWGAGLTLLANFIAIRSRSVVRWLDLLQSNSSIFYPILFFVSYQIADMFFSARGLIHALAILWSGT